MFLYNILVLATRIKTYVIIYYGDGVGQAKTLENVNISD